MTSPQVNSFRAWILAARPKTLAGAAVPVLIGAGMAYADGIFRTDAALLCFAFAFLMQINANFINDLYDFLKGTDRDDRLGPERACAQGWITPSAMKWGIGITTATAVVVGLFIWVLGGIWMLPIGILCILFAFFYTTGPYPLAYHGWGDLAVLIFFGWIPVGCTYYLMTDTLTWQVITASTACGLVIDTLLMVNNFRDREQDALSHKLTLVVRFGAKAGIRMYIALGLAAWLCCLILAFSHGPLYALLPFFYLLPHLRTAQQMQQINKGRALNRLLGATSMNILLFGILFLAACLLSAFPGMGF